MRKVVQSQAHVRVICNSNVLCEAEHLIQRMTHSVQSSLTARNIKDKLLSDGAEVILNLRR